MWCNSQVLTFLILILCLAESVVRGWRAGACCREVLVPRCRTQCRRATTVAELRRHCRASDETDLFRCLQQRKKGKRGASDPEIGDNSADNVTRCCGDAETAGCRAACLLLQQESPTAQAELHRQPPKAQAELHRQPPAAQAGLHRQPPAAQAGLHRQPPAAQVELHRQPPTAQVELHRQPPTAQVELHRQPSTVQAELLRKASTAQAKLLRKASTSQAELRKWFTTKQCGKEDTSFWTCLSTENNTDTPSTPRHQLELQCCPLATSGLCRHLCQETYSFGWHHQGPRFEGLCLSREYDEPELRRCIRDAEVPCQPNSGRLQFCGKLIDGSSGLYRRWDAQADDQAKTQYINWVRHGMLDVPFQNRSILATSSCRAELRKLACFVHLQPCEPRRHQQAHICRTDCRRLAERCLPPSADVPDIDAVCVLLSSPEHSCVPLPPAPMPADKQRELVDAGVTSPCLPNPCGPSQVCRVGHPNQSPYICRPGCRLSTVSPRMVEEGATVLLPSTDERGKLGLLTCAPGGVLVECRRITPPKPTTCDFHNHKIESMAGEQPGCLRCFCVDGEKFCARSEECAKSSHLAPSIADVGRTKCRHKLSDSCLRESAIEDPCAGRPCRPGFRCKPEPQLYVDSTHPNSQHICVAESSGAIRSLVSDCLRSQPQLTFTGLLQRRTRSPSKECPPQHEHCLSGTNCDQTTSQCGRYLKLYFSSRRLAVLGSPVTVRAVLETIQLSIATTQCAVSGYLDAEREMTVHIHPATSDVSPSVRRACQLETDKLHAWLATDSPVVTSEPSLWPVVYSEFVTQARTSGGVGRNGVQTVMVLLSASVILFM